MNIKLIQLNFGKWHLLQKSGLKTQRGNRKLEKMLVQPRREVLFSVCCVESYLLEWVRDEVLNQDLKGVTRYFPPGQKKGISEKWKEIPKKLRADGLITAVPNYGTKIFGDFKNLVAIRDGIVHASSSRPVSAKMPNHGKPFPTLSDLQTMKPGWALGVVVILLEDLHETLKTSKPLWLEYS